MAVKEILLLGNPQLYEPSAPVEPTELDTIAPVVQDLHDTMMNFRATYGAGRAIAAPQIGFQKRLLYMHITEPVVFINPTLNQKSQEMITVWDDCMSFPEILVKVKRHKSCQITYYDMNWESQSMWLEDDLSELLQHEYDHLDGVLAVSKAIDAQSFALRSQSQYLSPDQMISA